MAYFCIVCSRNGFYFVILNKSLTNAPAMHQPHSHNASLCYKNVHVCTFVLKIGALSNICLIYCGISEMDLLHLYYMPPSIDKVILSFLDEVCFPAPDHGNEACAFGGHYFRYYASALYYVRLSNLIQRSDSHRFHLVVTDFEVHNNSPRNGNKVTAYFASIITDGCIYVIKVMLCP